jgi:hypothetical protein
VVRVFRVHFSVSLSLTRMPFRALSVCFLTGGSLLLTPGHFLTPLRGL